MEIIKKHFGTTVKGYDVNEYTMINDKNASVSILTLGGIIRQINVPDKDGNIKNVVYGFNQISGYESSPGFIGAAIGRSSGRISGGLLPIDDTIYTLAKNDGNNNLHGGPNALDKVVWDACEFQDATKMSITLNYLSPDLEEGFPGELDCNITYSFDNNNALGIRYTCTTDKKTFVNMTNHSYFNLSGDFTTKITDHLLEIKADHLVSVDEFTIPVAIVPVEGTAFDFRTAKPIGQDILADEEQLRFGSGYDHAFELNQPTKEPLIVAKDLKTGRVVKVTTDAACVVLYTGNFLKNDHIAAGNVPLQSRAAFCLETQYYPDAINAPFIKSKFLEPGQVYKTTTTFHFSVD